MSLFSEYLSDYIEDRDLSWKKAAELCNIDRTLLRRYAKGENLPKDEKRVLAIASGLHMEKQQKEKLCRLYHCEKTEEMPYQGQMLIDRIFDGKYRTCGNDDSEKVYIERKWDWEREQVKRIEGEEAMLQCIDFLVAGAEMVYFQLPVPLENEKLCAVLSEVSVKCRLEQIVEVNNAGEGQEELEMFEELFPLLLAGRDYTVFCYYKWKKAKKDSLQTGMFLTDKGLLLFDRTLAQGVYTNLEEYKEYYEKIFERERNQCTVFAQSGERNRQLLKGKTERGCIENAVSGITFSYIADDQGELIWVRDKGKSVKGCCIMEIRLVGMIKEYTETILKERVK